ncbi:MAG: carboxypeptidase M32 [Bacteroidia bacterium]|nr:carboxypeptidase M32 [Bacteroidia bacterium]MDW8158042.1 carboxypeptidase M32 [Bacteroidia bacterium]
MQGFEAYHHQKKIIADLEAAINLLQWDQEVNNIKGSLARRASQLGTLSAIKQHKLINETYPLVQKLCDAPNLSTFEQKNIEQDLKDLKKITRLSVEFAAQLAEACSWAQSVWEEAKKESNFKIFEEPLEKLLNLKRQEAEYYGYDTEPYDALLDIYEPGAQAKQIAELFSSLIPPIKDLLSHIQKKTKPAEDILINQIFPKEKQWALGIDTLKHLGFNFEKGHVGVSSHPFSIAISMEDVRITTRIDENNLHLMLYSTIHECGHALYEQGLPPEYYGLPVAQACSLSIHESQSRLWENNIGRSLAFCEFLFPQLVAYFPDALQNYTAYHFYQSVNRVEPSLIRILADELTYHLHIALRFELERSLINGQLKVKELPEAWNQLIKEYLGLEVPNDAQGVLQDIHWSLGSFGYFPTYSLGSLYAAQFYNTLQKQIPNLQEDIKQGKFESIHQWLQENIYSKGRLYTSEEICQAATGEKLNPQHFIDYLKNKLETIY